MNFDSILSQSDLERYVDDLYPDLDKNKSWAESADDLRCLGEENDADFLEAAEIRWFELA